MKEKFINLYFALSRHFAVGSDFLFSVLFGSSCRIASFSARHKLQSLPLHLYDGAYLCISHIKLIFYPVCLASQKAFDSVVGFFFSFLNDWL